MAMSRSLYECGNDEVRDDDGVTDICSFCATDGKLQPALHFCFDCGVYGRYICGLCLRQHSKFLNNHEVERIANQTTSKRKKDSNSKVKALEESNAELQKDKTKFQKEKAELLVNIHDVRKENEKLTKDLSDCKEALDLANNELKTRTEEFERETKGKDYRKKDSNSKVKALEESNAELQKDKTKFQKEKAELLVNIHDVRKENEKLTKDLSDCKEALDSANNELKTRTEEFERETKEKDYRRKDSNSKVNALEESNAELQEDKTKLQKEKAELLVNIHDVRKENKNLTKDLSDCKEALDSANNELKTKTEEFERETKEKDYRSKSLMIANENLQRDKNSLETERAHFLATLNELKKENTTMSEKLQHYKVENTEHAITKEAYQQEVGCELRVKDSLKRSSKLSESMCNSGVKHSNILAVAIEIGNASSGYAFSFLEDYNKDPSKVSVQKWLPCGTSLYKTSTVVLFNVNKTFHAFGHEAEEKYEELVEDGEHHEWYYFRRFMLTLQDKKIAKNDMLVDDKGKKMKAIDVLSAVITYLKDHLLKLFKTGVLRARDIHWVIPVPVIWTDTAKQIMREAACKSDINDADLTLVSEPEAASFFCQTIHENDVESSTKSISNPGMKFMAIDLGDSSASFTVFVRQSDGGLQEVKTATVVQACYTNMVQSEFNQLMRNIVGDYVYQRCIDENPYDYRDLQRDIAVKMRTEQCKKYNNVTLDIPVNFQETLEKIKDETFYQAINKSQYRGKLQFIGSKLRMDAEVFKNLFKPGTDKIVGYIQHVLKDQYVQGTEIFLMVGQVSESSKLQEAVIRAFPNINVIIPQDPDLAVMRGAVIYGHQH